MLKVIDVYYLLVGQLPTIATIGEFHHQLPWRELVKGTSILRFRFVLKDSIADTLDESDALGVYARYLGYLFDRGCLQQSVDCCVVKSFLSHNALCFKM